MKFEKGRIPWNKGLKYSKFDEPSCKRLRRSEVYRLTELRKNAIRAKEKGYDDNRYEEIAIKRKERANKIGYFNPRKWNREEIDYLYENKGGNYSEIATYLDRSLSSVEHKMSRLGLQKYNKWSK